jgi:PIN domain nuclease of toxin-antitoxin system
VRLLLDANSFLWWTTDPDRLPSLSQEAIADEENNIIVGVGSLWEIAIKRSLGKLHFPHDLETVLRDEEFGLLSISYAHLSALEALPLHHRDPFDRLLIAQSIAEDLPVITNDRFFALYDVKTFW